MLNDLIEIQARFEELVANLAALVELHSTDAVPAAKLVQAQQSAMKALQLIQRQLEYVRSNRDLD